jgi:PKD domain
MVRFALGRTIIAVVALTLALGATAAPSASAATGKLSYGGPVLHSSRPYLVFWTPSGESIPASSRSLAERYFTDVVAESGKATNVFGVLRQYYDRAGFADYRQTFNPARQVIVDTQPYPPQDPAACPDRSTTYPTCISDGQIHSELGRLITADRLPSAGPASASELSANAPVYFVILPANVDVCQAFGALCTDNKICGYHQAFVDSRGDQVLYAPLPLAPLRAGSLLVPDPKGVCQWDNTRLVQTPNGDVAGDLLIDGLSHEYNEAIIDPIWGAGWLNSGTHQENGDQCQFFGPFNPAKDLNPSAFLPTLGGSAAAGTLYTQLINGHRYYTQSEWSNGDNNCEMRPSRGRIAPRFAVPHGPRAGALLSFNPAASTSRNALSSATWNFGDGSQTSFFSGKAALTPARHRYRRAGRYTITLTLVDNRGNLKTTTRRVTIHAR